MVPFESSVGFPIRIPLLLWLYHVLFLRYSEILVKNCDFFITLAFGTPQGIPHRTIPITFATAKTRLMWLLDGLMTP